MLARKVKSVAARLGGDERAFRRCWPLIQGVPGLLVSPHQERWLFTAARRLPEGANIVEIGAFKGRSTCCFAFGCRGTGKRVYSIDTFNGNDVDFAERDFFDTYWANVQRCQLAAYVTPCRGLSDDLAQTWARPIHLLFIDGLHTYEQVLADFDGFFRHVVPGGIVALHDVDEAWPGVSRAWYEHIRDQLVEVGTCRTLAFGRKPK